MVNLREAFANGKFLSVMLGSSVLVYLRRLEPVASVEPPGDPRLWQALRATLGPVACRRGLVLRVEWPEGSEVPDSSFYERALSLPKLYECTVLPAFRAPTLLVRGRGGGSHPLSTLFAEWLTLRGCPAPSELWVAESFELERLDGSPETTALTEATERLLTLGERSGIYSPDGEEALVFRTGESGGWPLVIEGQTLPSGVPLSQVLLESCAGGEHSLIRRNVLVRESRPRTPTAVTELKPAIQDTLWAWNTIQDPVALGCLASPPLHFLVGAPVRPDAANWAFEARAQCERVSGFYDRALGTMDLRTGRTAVATVEVTSPLPLSHRPLSIGIGPQKSVLYAIGPWDARNPLMERRIESLIVHRLRDFPIEGEVVEGRQDWAVRLGQILGAFEGWTFDETGLRALLAGNFSRNRHQRLGLFWGAEELAELGPLWGLPLLRLGTKNTESRFVIGEETLKPRGLVWPSESVEEATWTYPELKSPTYGYEKATLFPDRYLAKVVVKESSLHEWHSQLWISSGGDRLRSAPHRNEYSTSLDGFRWTDGERLWAEAVGSKEGWSDVDPRQAGVACVDAAQRSLIALGAMPGEGGVASVWLTHPDDFAESEEGRAKLGAYLLAFQGVSQALQAFRFSVSTFNAFAPSYSVAKPEIRVFLRSRLASDSPQVVPGFRMSGEMLYAVGPRPAFMDAGSHLLSHVKVISNHLSRLVLPAQLELYALIWSLMKKGVITSIRPIGEGGIAGAAGEMALWGGMGAQLRPNLPTIELFSGAPGRFLVGVLPSEAKNFESLVKSELLTAVGMTGTEKVLGLPLDQLKEVRRGKTP